MRAGIWTNFRSAAISRPGRMLTLAATVAALALSAAGQSAPPGIDIPESALSKGLLPSHVAQIEAWTAYYAKRFAEADKEDEVLKVRAAWLSTYAQYDASEYRYTLAKKLVAQVLPLLEKDMPLKTVKEVNLAMAVSSMPQVTVTPALVKMVAHPNAAVRYLGWQGYLSVRMLVLAQTQELVSQMFQSLSDRAAKEDSPHVVRVMIQMLDLPPARPEAVSEGTYRQAREKSLALFQQLWAKLCRQALAGQADTAEAAQAGVAAIRNMGSAAASDKAAVQKLLQMAVDMTWCAGKAYDAGKDSADLAQAYAMLLRDGEGALAALSQRSRKYVDDALSDPKVIDRGAAVQLAVLKWIDELKDAGVVKPNIAPA